MVYIILFYFGERGQGKKTKAFHTAVNRSCHLPSHQNFCLYFPLRLCLYIAQVGFEILIILLLPLKWWLKVQQGGVGSLSWSMIDWWQIQPCVGPIQEITAAVESFLQWLRYAPKITFWILSSYLPALTLSLFCSLSHRRVYKCHV